MLELMGVVGGFAVVVALVIFLPATSFTGFFLVYALPSLALKPMFESPMWILLFLMASALSVFSVLSDIERIRFNKWNVFDD